VLLCALVGLTIGAAVLGFAQAPSSADLAAHNAVGETMAASGFTALSSTSQTKATTTLAFTAPARVVLSGASGGVHRRLVLNGQKALRVLNPISSLTTVNGFTVDNGVYKAALPNPTLTQENASEQVLLTISNGYLNTLIEQVTLNNAGDEGTISGTLKFLEVAGTPVPTTK